MKAVKHLPTHKPSNRLNATDETTFMSIPTSHSHPIPRLSAIFNQFSISISVSFPNQNTAVGLRHPTNIATAKATVSLDSSACVVLQ